MVQVSQKRHVLLIYVVLALATFIAFEQVRNNGFVYDDDQYIVNNPHVQMGITRESVVWAFTTDYGNNWHPLTWLSHMLDCQFFGLNPLWPHLVNLLFHILNTLLLFAVLKRMTGAVWCSGFVAAAFALHPLHVESVAWVAERKDVLSTLFWLLTMAAYVRYTEHPDVKRYLFVFLLFALGLMAKPMLVTLPFVLLLLDFWPLERFARRQQSRKPTYQKSTLSSLVAEKIPLFILVAASSGITLIGEGAGATTEHLSPNMGNALVSYIKYIGKMVYPSGLTIFYPHPANSLPVWQPVVSFLILAVITMVVIYLARRKRYLAVGWLWYLGTLLPVIGLVQVGSQAMADRYTYLPSIGFFIIVAWGVTDFFAKWGHRKVVLGISAAVVFVAMLVCTRAEVKHWKNNITLFGRSLAVTKNNFIMHNNYGNALRQNGQLEEAIIHFNEALRLDPKYFMARNNISYVFRELGRHEEAVASFTEVLRLKPDYPDAINDLGIALQKQGKIEQAVEQWKKAVQLKPDHPNANFNLGLAMREQGKYDAAIKYFNGALRARKDWAKAHYYLGDIYYRQNKLELTVAHWTEMVKLKPNSAEVLGNLAWIMATSVNSKVYNPAEIVKFAQRACELTGYKKPEMLQVLAAAYAAQNSFGPAVEAAEKAIKLAESTGKETLASEIQRQLELYRVGKPYRQQ